MKDTLTAACSKRDRGRYQQAVAAAGVLLDAVGGAWTQVNGSPFQTGPYSDSIAFSPRGGLLAAPSGSDDKVYVYSVNHATGELTQRHGSPFQVGSDPYSVAFNPQGICSRSEKQAARAASSVYAVHLAPKS